MARNFDSFAKRLRSISATIDGNLVEGKKDVMYAAGSHVIDKTPVDTGQAITGWIGTVNERTYDAPEAAFPGNFGSTGATNRSAAKDRLERELKRSRHVDDVLILQNNHKYIIDLNNGSSKQAPANFVQSAVIAGANTVKKIRLLKKRGRGDA